MKKISIAVISFLLGTLFGIVVWIFIGAEFFGEKIPVLSLAGEPTNVPLPTESITPNATLFILFTTFFVLFYH